MELQATISIVKDHYDHKCNFYYLSLLFQKVPKTYHFITGP